MLFGAASVKPARRAALFIALSLACLAGEPGADTQSCAEKPLRIASTRDFKSSPQGRSLVFETLVALDNHARPVPLLATSWRISDDRREVVFELRREVMFHSGEPFDASAAAYAVREAATRAGFGRYVSEVAVIDSHRIRVSLTQPYWPLLNELSFEHLAPVVEPSTKQRATRSGAAADSYSGTGPFVLRQYRADVGADLIANANYWRQPPGIAVLQWKTMPDPDEHIPALKEGRVDVVGAAEHHGALPYDAFRALINDPRFETRFRSYGRHQVLDFNVTHPVLQDTEVRLAIHRGIDRQQLVQEHLGGIPAAETTLYPPRPEWSLGSVAMEQGVYDPARAADLLEAAGWQLAEQGRTRYRGGKPLAVALLVNQHESNALAAAHFVRGSLQQIGFKARVDAVPGSEVSRRLKAGDFDIHVSHTCSAAQLGCLGARGKYTRFNDTAGLYTTPALERRIDEALMAADGSQRSLLFEKLWRDLDQHMVGTPLFDVVKPMAHRVGVRGIGFGSTVLSMDLSGAEVEEDAHASCGQ